MDPLAGYVKIRIDRRGYWAHRLAWLYVHGRWPERDEVDHENGVRHDNRLDNLRDATSGQNRANRSGPTRASKTGYRGVTSSPNGKRFVAWIGEKGKSRNLGTFDTAEEAAQVAADERAARFGEYAGQA